MPKAILDIYKAQASALRKSGNGKAKDAMKSLESSMEGLEALKSRIVKSNEWRTEKRKSAVAKTYAMSFKFGDDERHVESTSMQGLARGVFQELTGETSFFPSLALDGKPTRNFNTNFNAVLNVIREAGGVITKMPNN